VKGSQRVAAAAMAVAILFGTGLVVSQPATAGTPADKPVGRILMVSVPRLTWSELSRARTPNLYRFARSSAVGDLSLRTISPRTSLSEAYVTIGAGNRASAGDSDGGRLLAPGDVYENGTAGEVFRRRTGWKTDGALLQLSVSAILAQNDRYLFGAKPGALGQVLRDNRRTPLVIANADLELAAAGLDPNQTPPDPTDVPETPVLPRGPSGQIDKGAEPAGGENRPAGLALMDQHGVVATGSIDRRLLMADPRSPFGVRMSSFGVLDAVTKGWRRSSVGLVELSDLDRVDLYRGRAGNQQASVLASRALRQTDDLFGSLLAATRPTDLVMLVAPVAPRAGETLTPLAMRGPGFESGLLVSGTTRRPGYVTLADIAPTLLERLHITQPDVMTGSPISASNSGDLSAARWDHFVHLNAATHFRDRIGSAMTVLFVVLQVAFCVLAIAALAFSTPRLRMPSAALALFTMCIPAVTFLLGLLPRADPGFWPYLMYMVLGAAVMAAACHLASTRFGPKRRPVVGAVLPAAISFVLLAVDITTHGHLQINTVFGYSPVVAGRFSGFGNTAYAIFAMSAVVLVCGMWSIFDGNERGVHRGVLTVAVSAIFVVAVVLDGFPSFGSDVGGTLSIIPTGFQVIWLLLGRRVRWRMVLGAVLATVVMLSVFAAIDLQRPKDSQTHLGRLARQLSGGGDGGALVLQRKVNANLSILTSSVWTWTIPLALVLIVRFTRRRPRVVRDRLPDSSSTRAVLWGGITLCVLGTMVNDSGVAIAGVMFMIFLPYVVYLTVSPATPLAPTLVSSPAGSPARSPARASPGGPAVPESLAGSRS